MSRRGAITMTPEEVAGFVDGEHTVVLGTVLSDGRPHLVPLWFARAGETIEAWSFGKAQKIRNLRRDARATLLFEAGTSYEELRGVSMDCDAELVEDAAEIERLGFAVASRYADAPPGSDAAEGVRAFVRSQVAKRVGMRFHPTRVRSWDHGKLGGQY